MPEHIRAPVLADLRLDDIVVEALSVRTDIRHTPVESGDEQLIEIDVSVDILRSNDEPRFMIPLSVRLNHGREAFNRSGYSFDTTVVGFFSFDADISEDHISHLIQLNAPSILYGVIRGIAAQTLSITNVGKVVLPSLNFVEIMRNRADQIQRKSRRSRRPPTIASDQASSMSNDP